MKLPRDSKYILRKCLHCNVLVKSTLKISIYSLLASLFTYILSKIIFLLEFWYIKFNLNLCERNMPSDLVLRIVCDKGLIFVHSFNIFLRK